MLFDNRWNQHLAPASGYIYPTDFVFLMLLVAATNWLGICTCAQHMHLALVAITPV